MWVLDRRRFLTVVAGAAAYTALRPHWAWAARSRSRLLTLQPWTLPAEAGRSPIEVARNLVGAAVLAPSHWNTQPWRFECEGTSIRLVADTQRSLPVIDPDQRNLYAALGAALENMVIAARAYGLRPNVTYFPHGGANQVVAEIAWTNGEMRRDRALFAAIPERRTNRREYDGRGIYMQNRAQLIAQIPDGVHLHWVDDRRVLRGIADGVHESVRARVLEPRAQTEQFGWMRFGDDDAQRRGDGITVESLEIGGLAGWLGGRTFRPRSWLLRFGAEGAARQARTGVRTAGALALLTMPRAGEAQWLAAGQAYERFALRATELGIAHQPLSEPLENSATRTEVLQRFGANGEQPVLLVRLGHAKRPPASVRRSVALVASFRNS